MNILSAEIDQTEHGKLEVVAQEYAIQVAIRSENPIALTRTV